MSDRISLKTMLQQPEIVLASGVYDALTASLATDAGFGALYLSGASIAYTRLGRPDIGLVTMSEVAETLSLIRDRVATPLIVDADTGYGNALNVQRTVRLETRMMIEVVPGPGISLQADGDLLPAASNCPANGSSASTASTFPALS